MAGADLGGARAPPIFIRYQKHQETFEQTCCSMKPIKLVIVGDSEVQKAAFLISYVSGRFPEMYTYCRTAFENCEVDVMLDGKAYTLSLWDTSGGEDFARLRPLSYPDTGVFLVCFSIVAPASFMNVWNEVLHFKG